MQLREIMTREVQTVRPDMSIQQAAQAMMQQDVGLLPVCDHGDVVGTITDRDITVRAVASGRSPQKTPVSEVMSSEAVYCYEDQDIEEAAELMGDQQIRRVPILDRQRHLVGIVSLADLATRADSDDETPDVAEKALEEISEPSGGSDHGKSRRK